MPANDDFEFFDALGDRRTLEAVMDTVDGMEPREALFLLNVARAIDALYEADAVGVELEGADRIADLVGELAVCAQVFALAIHEREAD